MIDSLNIISTIVTAVLLPFLIWLAQRSIALETRVAVIENQNATQLKATEKLEEQVDDLLWEIKK